MALEYSRVDGPVKTPSLTLYSLSYCEVCREAGNLLSSLGLAYRYLLVDKLPRQQILQVKREIQAAGQKSILYPVLRIEGDETLYGFDETLWTRKLEQTETARVN
jgi:glutaredoxin